jgi:Ca2+/Na+ antiporter
MILSRGWFDSANEISAILFGLLPLNILMFFKEKKINNAILFIGQFAAMIILGTKTSATGAVLISYFALVIYLFLTVIKRKKVEIKQVITFVVCLGVLTLFYYNSPFYLSRTHEIQVQEQLKVTAKEETILKDDKEDKKDKDNKEEKEDKDNKQDKDDKEDSAIKEEDLLKKEEAKKEEQANFIMSNLYSYRINYVFTEIYPVKNDIEFWTRLSKRELYLNNDSRQMKIDILSRIKERNNNKLDNLFGLGYTLNFMDVERDYVYQFLLFGGLGVILFLGVYFIILGKSIVKCIFNLKKTICFDVALGFMAPCLMFVIAYLSGHVFGWVSPMMYISFVLGFLNHRVEESINES